MNNDLKILITGTLNTGKSIGEINTAIKGIQRKIKALQLNVKINDKTTKTLRDFSKAMERMQEVQHELDKAYKEQETVFKKLDGSVEKVNRKFLKSGAIYEKTTKVVNEKAKATNDEADATRRLATEIDGLGKKQQKIIKQDGKGNLTGTTDRYRNGYIDTIVNADKDGKVTSMRIVDNLKQEDEATQKLIKSKNELRQKHQELIQTGQLSTQQSLNLQKMIETSSDGEGIKKATDEHKRLLNISKEQLKVEQAKINVAKKKDEEIKKEKEHNRIIEQKLDLYKKEQALKVQDLKHRYKDAIDVNALDAHLGKVNGLTISKDTPRLMRETALGLKQIEINAKQAGGALGKAHSHSISLTEAFQTAMVKFPINPIIYVGIKLL